MAIGILVAWADVAALYFRGRQLLGHWPIRSLEDPQDLDLTVHFASASFAAWIILGATLLALLVLGLDVAFKRKPRVSRLLGFVTVASLALWMLTPMVGWILD